MNGWTIRQRTIASFAAILMLMLVMGAMVFAQLLTIDKEVAVMRSDTLPGLDEGTRLLSAWEDDYALTLAHVIEEDPAAHARLHARVKANAELRDRLAEAALSTLLPVSDPKAGEDRGVYDAFVHARDPYQSVQREVVRLSSDPKTRSAATALVERQLNPAFDRLRSALTAMVLFDKNDTDDSAAQIEATVASAKGGIAATSAIAVALAFICGFLLLRSITRTLRQVAGVATKIGAGDLTVKTEGGTRRGEIGVLVHAFDAMVGSLSALVGQVQRSGMQVNTSVTEIAATAKQQQAAASETAATVSEIGATSREIAATSRELLKTMGEVSAVAEHTATLAGTGQSELVRMEETMRSVVEAAGSINEKLATLSEKAANINQVVSTITKVADQTNLLSLNAAIEAEKAGEYGRGFSVVATEIRRLADQTAIATFDIEQMVKEIQSAVSAGVMGMDKFSDQVRRGMQEVQTVGEQLAQIIHQVQALAPRVESVNEGMQAQTMSAEQITQALGQLSEAAQQTVESLHQSSQAIDELGRVSIGLRKGVSGFIVETGVMPLAAGR